MAGESIRFGVEARGEDRNRGNGNDELIGFGFRLKDSLEILR